MSVSELILNAKEQGVHLFVREGKLGFKLIGALFPEQLKADIQSRKAEVIAFLTAIEDAKQNKQLDGEKLCAIARTEPCYPLSYNQRSMLFIQTLDTESVTYNCPGSIKVEGHFRPEIAEQAFTYLLNRHEVLRTVYRQTDQGGMQFVLEAFNFSMPVHDISAEKNQSELVYQYQYQDFMKPFNLAEDLMFRAQFLRLSDNVGVLLYNIHHIATDGWSMKLLIAEFSEVYQALSEGKPIQLPELPLQYIDYACWQQKHLKGPFLERQLQYWERQLAGAPQYHSLPVKCIKGGLGDISSNCIVRSLSAELSAQSKHLATECSATLFMLLHAVFSVTLSRFSGMQDISVGTPIANRSYKKLENTVGYFINALVLRVQVDETLTMRKFINDVRQVNMSAHANSDIPFDLLVDKFCPDRGASTSPLFQFMLKIEDAEEEMLKQESLAISNYEQVDDTAKFDIELVGHESHGEITLSFKYNTELFNTVFMTRIIDSFCHLLRCVVELPDEAIGTFAALPVDGNASMSILSKPSAVATLDEENYYYHFLKSAQKHPSHTAVSHQGKRWSYSQLLGAVNGIAHSMLDEGVQVSERVAVMIAPGFDLVAAQLAIMAIGAVYVPIDVTHPKHRIEAIIENAGIQRIVVNQADSCWLESVKIIDCTDIAPHSDIVFRKVSGRELAYVMYTSGSTGKPKGVAVAHQQLTKFVFNVNQRVCMGDSDIVPAIVSATFDISVFEVLASLVAGAEVRMVDLAALTQPELLIEQTSDATIFHAVPSLMSAILEVLEGCKSGYPRLKTVMSGGDKVPVQLLRNLRDRFPAARILEIYGPTETTVFASIYVIEPGDEILPACIGDALPGTHLSVRDKHAKLVPVGVVGELYISGDGVTDGYLNNAELTAQSFVEMEGVRYYRSGDLVHQDERGLLRYIGRKDDQIKIRGQRIELREIERCLLECASVCQAQVFVSQGEQPKIFASVRSDSISQSDTNGILNELRQKLPKYMIPSAIYVTQQWPLNINGKIDKKQLMLACEAINKNVELQSAEPLTTQTEKDIAQAWQAVLQLSERTFYKNHNFFELGGHSLLVFKVVKRLTEQGYKIEVKDVLETQDIAELAIRIIGDGAARTETSPYAVRLNQEGNRVLFAIHPFGGGVDNYKYLANDLDGRLTLIGIQAPYLAEISFRFNTMKELAEHYVEHIQLVQPQGPYALLGWSGGGGLAYLMALCLLRRGEQVDYLGMLDSYAPQAHKLPEDIASAVEKIQTAFDLNLSAEELVPIHDESSLLDLVRGKARQGNNEFAQSELLEIGIAFGLDFLNSPFEGEVLCGVTRCDNFYATKNPKHLRNLAHWQAWINAMEVAVDCDHVDIVDEPNSTIISRVLLSALDSIE
ncbi:amino acid adenylation domain-containing protein [Pseudoalteromonas sp. GCY]|uniref:non-ribosomal peptide synthetase n=1 Tax=Pseudoalteromonas sp. GCY TaxID=2003316 RepID=UPI001556F4F1|nr:non-ribosomal peptide synthetase [Pseudoalteromonas sp. GCY]QQQ65436.1 amino acid adenylation domain-containing protein [Pseudoalteromonas sp. GCY]